MNKAVLAALLIYGIGLPSAPALANGLEALDAYACGIEPTATSDPSNDQDPLSFDGGNDFHDAYGMVKMKIYYRHPAGYSNVEHCGATVVNSSWLVTAAHCLDQSTQATAQPGQPPNKKWDRLVVFAGQDTLDTPGILTRKPWTAVCHAGFGYRRLMNDIALIKLDRPLPESQDTDWFPLDDYRRPSTREGSIVTVLGWPVTGIDAGEPTLQITSHPVIAVNWPGYITGKANGLEGPCRGESGGPVMGMKDGYSQVAGVLSGIEPKTEDASGEPCMKPDYEFYYTPIAGYRDWIDAVIAHCDQTPWECEVQ